MARNKKNKNKIDKTTLDLHGLKHADVDRIVENHIFLTPYPHDIITGNSAEMHQLAKAVLDRHKFRYEIGDFNNHGYLRVLGY
ncbi:MAG: hypothetical protein AABY15_01805 [Nanoarchaeota archaeon]